MCARTDFRLKGYLILATTLLRPPYISGKACVQKSIFIHVICDVAVYRKMAAGLDWTALPSVIIVEIFSYLSKSDRVRISSVCRRWRQCLFHPCLWSRVDYELCLSKRQKSRFLSDRCGRFIRQAIVKFNSHNITEVRECFRILKILAENKNIQSFALQPSSCHIEWPESQPMLYDR